MHSPSGARGHEIKTVFLAGATGAVGTPLSKMLIDSKKYRVFGLTRSVSRASELRSIGVEPVIADVYNRAQLAEEVQKIGPSIVIHQLTDLPFGLPKEKMPAGQIANARIRTEGTANLIETFATFQPELFLVQSIAFMYEDGPLPHIESDRLGTEVLRAFESQVQNSRVPSKIVRYGRFYGPKTGFDNLEAPCRIHVDAAAHACILLIEQGSSPIYNVCEDSEYASNSRIIAETIWDPGYRIR